MAAIESKMVKGIHFTIQIYAILIDNTFILQGMIPAYLTNIRVSRRPVHSETDQSSLDNAKDVDHEKADTEDSAERKQEIARRLEEMEDGRRIVQEGLNRAAVAYVKRRRNRALGALVGISLLIGYLYFLLK